MRIEFEMQLDFKDVLIRPKRSSLSSRSDVCLEKKYVFKSGAQWEGIPVIAANMDTVGTISMAKVLSKHRMLTALHKYYSVESLIDFFGRDTSEDGIALLKENRHPQQHTFYSMGIVKKDLERFRSVVSKVGIWKHAVSSQEEGGIRMVCIDVANGYMQSFIDFCKAFKAEFPDLILMAGNVVTGDIVEELIFSGVDIVKVGIGSGSACTTRRVAGVGRSQLSAIIDCADAAHGLKGFVCADGGCTNSGDIAKAFGANSDFVMLGGILSAHTESEAPIQMINDKQMVSFYGMSSNEALNKYHNGKTSHRASEGKNILLEYRGNVEQTILELLGGIRSACTYVGAVSLKELPKRTTFYQVTMQTNNIYGV